jgi:hypothetical protein
LIRDRASAVRPWATTAALYLVVMLSAGFHVIPRWTGDAAPGVWLAHLALQRDQALAKEVLGASFAIAAVVRLVGGVAGAPIAVRAGVLEVVGTLAVFCLGARPADRDAHGAGFALAPGVRGSDR